MLLDQIQDQVTATDLNGRITYVNAAKCRALGRTSDELIGESIAVYDDHDPAGIVFRQQVIETVLANGQWRGEVNNVAADGRKIVLDSRVQLIHDESGEPVGLLGVSTDISERKGMERQLRQQERLAAVGQLASGIAHDFRNSLTTIILYAGLPLQKADLPADLAANLETVIEEADKATDLVQQILDFSSSSMIERKRLDLEPFLEDVLSILSRTLPETVTVTLRGGSGPYPIEADAGRLQQAITNLALNARDAMPHGGDLHVSLSRVTVAPDGPAPVADMSPGEWICLAVSDTGTGMTEHVQEHLFEPFFTTKEVGKGTGLGLAQVYGIVRQHGGTIDVETAVGQGTTFKLYLPAYGGESRPSTEREEPPPSYGVPRGRGETILVVEDEENVRRAAKSILETLGYRVLTAANGREALALCQSPRWLGDEHRIDLVVTDMVMPEMGGRKLLENLREAQPTLKAVAITGYALRAGDVRSLKQAGFLDVIRKPFVADDLALPIRRALDA
jgi:PAS domain S-box-containing protein